MAKFKKILGGGAKGGGIGASIGAGLGAVAGSIIPGAGTAAGAIAGAQIGGAIGSIVGGKNVIDSSKAEKQTSIALGNQAKEQAQAEKDKYQAMVDANFSDVAKKRSKMTGRPGSGLYAGLSGGSGGLYNV